MSAHAYVDLSRENGKKLSVDSTPTGVGIIVWRKNDSPGTVLNLTVNEAKAFRDHLINAIKGEYVQEQTKP